MPHLTFMSSLCIAIGPDYDHLTPIQPNKEHEPFYIHSGDFMGRILIRLNHLTALPNAPPPSAYFHNVNRHFSFQIQGRFMKEYTGDQVFFGLRFSKRPKFPTGTSLVANFAKTVDPGMVMDLTAERPYSLSPLLCAMNQMSVQEWSKEGLPSWTHVGQNRVKERGWLEKTDRKTFFLTKEHREAFVFSPSKVYELDFYNPFMDLGNLKITLPFLKVDFRTFWDGSPLYYVAETKTGTPLFVIQLTLY